jgi:hypothetical protein
MNKKLGRLPSNNRTRKLPTPIAFSFSTPTQIRIQFLYIYQAMGYGLQILVRTGVYAQGLQK